MFKNKKLYYIIVLLTISISIFFSFFIHFNNICLAQGNIPSMVDGLSEDCRASGTCELNDIVGLSVDYYRNIFGMIGSLALLIFIVGGIMFLISGGNKEKIKNAKNLLIGAVIGLIIIFTSYMIIHFVVTSLGYSGGPWFQAPQ